MVLPHFHYISSSIQRIRAISDIIWKPFSRGIQRRYWSTLRIIIHGERWQLPKLHHTISESILVPAHINISFSFSFPLPHHIFSWSSEPFPQYLVWFKVKKMGFLSSFPIIHSFTWTVYLLNLYIKCRDELAKWRSSWRCGLLVMMDNLFIYL